MKKITIIGAGNLGQALAIGLTKSGQYNPSDISLTKRNIEELSHFVDSGYKITTDNSLAIEEANMIIVSVGPQDAEKLFHSIKGALNPNKHVIVSTITGVNINFVENIVGDEIPIIRIMPNTAVAICESIGRNGLQIIKKLVESKDAGQPINILTHSIFLIKCPCYSILMNR